MRVSTLSDMRISIDYSSVVWTLRAQLNQGYGEDVDVSTTQGAISTIPIGFAYLMFAPFPWQAATFAASDNPARSALAWWTLIPLMIYGMVYSLRHRLRSTFPICFFSLVFTLAYSIFQGNVGTAYRQGTQIQVFLFIFIAVGWEVWKERRGDRKLERLLNSESSIGDFEADDD